MALVLFPGEKMLFSSTQLGTNTYILGDASQGVVGTYSIQIVERVAGTCTFVVKARSRQAVGTAAQPPLVAIPFLPLHLNGAVQTYATGSSVTLTTDSVVLVPATGLDVALDVTFTDGEFDVYITRLLGSAA